MARKGRIEFRGAFYHVIIRGNQRRKIFKDEEDYLQFLDRLDKYKKRYRYFLYAYALMSNHVHLLIETGDIALSRVIQGINQSYTMYFNKKYRTVGHLFQGRYKAILCDKDEYLLQLVKYIHLNPVRAKLVNGADDFRWSSHGIYAEPSGESVVDTEQVLGMFSKSKGKARRLYREFMNESTRMNRDKIYSTVDQRILGDEGFIEEIKGRIEGYPIKGMKRKHEYTLAKIAHAIVITSDTTMEKLRGKSKSRDTMRCKRLFGIVAREYGYKGKEIAEYIHKDPAVITRYLRDENGSSQDAKKVHQFLKKHDAKVNKQV